MRNRERTSLTFAMVLIAMAFFLAGCGGGGESVLPIVAANTSTNWRIVSSDNCMPPCTTTLPSDIWQRYRGPIHRVSC